MNDHRITRRDWINLIPALLFWTAMTIAGWYVEHTRGDQLFNQTATCGGDADDINPL
jgi:hypothetical protein